MPESARLSTRVSLLAMFLFLATVALYMPVVYDGYDFIDFDDYEYIKFNRRIHAGFTSENLARSFTVHFTDGHAHPFAMPLTWHSYMLDIELFGLNPVALHAVNILWHAVNVVLLFAVFLAIARLTLPDARLPQAVWVSAGMALVFAVHPLQVESVVWIAERKNVLSTAFWLLALLAYFRYAKQPGRWRYLAVTVAFVFSLLSKPMSVTLPCLFLLLDLWPLRRISWPLQSAGERRVLHRLVAEKIPWFLLSLACSCWVYVSARHGMSLQPTSLPERLANAVVNYVVYLKQTVWPTDLCILYPYVARDVWQAGLATALLAAITVLLWRQVGRLPWLTVGWLWFLGTLLPVSGILQAGFHSTADRFTYVPNIGLWLLAMWAGFAFLERFRHAGKILAPALIVVVGIMVVATRQYLPYWKDTQTMFQRTVAITEANYVAYSILGNDAMLAGNYEQAEQYYRTCLKFKDDSLARTNLGSLLQMQGKQEEAKKQLLRAIRVDSRIPHAHYNLGLLYYQSGEMETAVACYQRAMTTDPGYLKAYLALGNLWGELGEYDKAMEIFTQAIRRDATNVEAHYCLGVALASSGQTRAAWQQYQILQSLDAGKAAQLSAIIRQRRE